MTQPSDDLFPLYKYRSLAGPYGREAAKGILLSNEMFWQSPLAFNDPFDCDPYWQFGSSARDRDSFLRRVVANQRSDVPRHERRTLKRTLKSRPVQEHEAQARESFRSWMAESAVTCFSSVSDSLLMWAHYANSHTGVCFEFRQLLDPVFVAHEVTYQGERPVADITQLDDTEVFKRAVLTKGKDWAYEHELRMIDYREPPGNRSFPDKALGGVILGARIADEDREFVRELIVRREGPRIATYQAVVCERRFGIEIVRVD